MIHDRDLLDRLAAFAPMSFDADVFRATRLGQNPLALSYAGGRWMVPGEYPALYTSTERDGALAELAFHWSLLTPIPSKPAALHRISISTRNTLRLIPSSLTDLGVDAAKLASINYRRTQEIGAAVSFLGCDGLLIPSARWSCQNLVVFSLAGNSDAAPEVLSSDEVDWKNWAAGKGLL